MKFSTASDLSLKNNDFYTLLLPYQLKLSINFLPSSGIMLQKSTTYIFWLAFLLLFILDCVLSYYLSLNYFTLVVENIVQFQSLYSDDRDSDALLNELNIIIRNSLIKNKNQNAEKKDGCLIISIANTGVPIDEATLNSLNRSFESYSETDGKHIGLVNISNRINLFYGKGYGCHAESNSRLTTIALTLPYIENPQQI